VWPDSKAAAEVAEFARIQRKILQWQGKKSDIYIKHWKMPNYSLLGVAGQYTSLTIHQLELREVIPIDNSQPNAR